MIEERKKLIQKYLDTLGEIFNENPKNEFHFLYNILNIIRYISMCLLLTLFNINDNIVKTHNILIDIEEELIKSNKRINGDNND